MNGNLHVVAFDVEHGNCVYVSTPNNRAIMVDAGCSEEFKPADFLYWNCNIRELDVLAISHPDHDHIQDLPNLTSLFTVHTLLRNPSIPEYMACPSDVSALDADKKYVSLNRSYNCPCPLHLDVRYPRNWGWVSITTDSNRYWDNPYLSPNDLSQVLRLRYGDVDILFPGDIGPSGVETLEWRSSQGGRPSILQKGPLPAHKRILFAPHHGRKSGICDELMDAFEPTIAIMSDKRGVETTDYDYYYRHCIGESVYSLSKAESQERRVLTTKTNGFVLLTASSLGASIISPN